MRLRARYVLMAAATLLLCAGESRKEADEPDHPEVESKQVSDAEEEKAELQDCMPCVVEFKKRGGCKALMGKGKIPELEPHCQEMFGRCQDIAEEICLKAHTHETPEEKEPPSDCLNGDERPACDNPKDCPQRKCKVPRCKKGQRAMYQWGPDGCRRCLHCVQLAEDLLHDTAGPPKGNEPAKRKKTAAKEEESSQNPRAPAKGRCPKVQKGAVGTCEEACEADRDCGDGSLCCSNGCGHTCTPAEHGASHADADESRPADDFMEAPAAIVSDPEENPPAAELPSNEEEPQAAVAPVDCGDCHERLAKAGEEFRQLEERFHSNEETFVALQQEAALVRGFPGFEDVERPEHGSRNTTGAGLLLTFRELRRMVQMEIRGIAPGAAMQMVSRTANDPLATVLAYTCIASTVFCTACILGRWQTMRTLFQLQVIFGNIVWTGIWVILAVLAAFVGKNPLSLVSKDDFAGFSLLVMCLFVYVAACNLFTLALARGSNEKSNAVVSVLVGTLLYWMLWELGRPQKDRSSVATGYSHIIFFLFSLLFAGFSIRDLYTVMMQKPAAAAKKARLIKARREKGDDAETEMFVIEEEEEEETGY